MSNKQYPNVINQATLFAYQLPFKRAIAFKQYVLTEREGLIVRLTDSCGVNRFAEISPLPGFSHETLAEVKLEMMALLSSSNMQLSEHKSHFSSIQFALNSLLPAHSNALTNHCSIDNIPLLQGNKEQIIQQYLQLNKPNLIKLKVARETVNIDIATFQSLCQLNPKLSIRADANQAWNAQQADLFFSAINVQQLDYIEEPTGDHDANVLLAERHQATIALDETLQQPDFNYQHHHMVKAFIIKPTIIGSREKIDQLVSIASRQGMEISFSSSFESIVGIQALQALANHYLTTYPQLAISLGIDTLKFFDGDLLINKKNIEQDCLQLEVLCDRN